MALLSSCLCCSLVRGALISSVYTAIVYLAALILEIYWIVEADVSLPAPAYIQAASYLVTIIMSFIMFFGATIKRCHFLLGWLFVMILFWIPECGLVILMTVHHWGLLSPNGTLEISFWVCRAVFNILSIVCVYSLYTTWKEEKAVMRRLENLNLTSVLPDYHHKEIGNSKSPHSKQASPYSGYRNYAFLSPKDFATNNNDSTNFAQNGRIGRSASSVSHLQYERDRGKCKPSTVSAGGIFLSNDDLRRLEHITAIQQILLRNQKDKSEFNPYFLTDYISQCHNNRGPHRPDVSNDASSLPPYSSSFSDLHSYRPRSLVGTDSENNYISRQFSFARNQAYSPSAVHPQFSTQSLDRSKYLRRKRASSVENLKLSSDDITLEKMEHRPFEYLNRPGSRQASENGSEVERIKDVAL